MFNNIAYVVLKIKAIVLWQSDNIKNLRFYSDLDGNRTRVLGDGDMKTGVQATQSRRAKKFTVPLLNYFLIDEVRDSISFCQSSVSATHLVECTLTGSSSCSVINLLTSTFSVTITRFVLSAFLRVTYT